MRDRIFQQAPDRLCAAEFAGERQRRLPATNRPGNGVDDQRTTPGDFLESMLRVQRRRDVPTGRAARINTDRRLPGWSDEPETVAADTVHVRANHCCRSGACDGRLDGVATIVQHRQPGCSGQWMRRIDRRFSEATGPRWYGFTQDRLWRTGHGRSELRYGLGDVLPIGPLLRKSFHSR